MMSITARLREFVSSYHPARSQARPMSQVAPRFNLPNTITVGIVNRPTTPAAHKLAQELLEKDRETHHCYFNTAGFHNHLSHHILAAFDFGAPAQLLQIIYDDEQKSLKPIDTDFDQEKVQDMTVITDNNWVEHLGKQALYASYLAFYTEQIAKTNSVQVLDRFLFSDEASNDPADMMHRFLGGAFHPIIQTGYGAEFGSDAMIAQGLAQASVHQIRFPKEQFGPAKPSTTSGTSLLEIMQQFYDSDVLKPVMPYEPDALLSKRSQDALKDGRPEKIRELCALWFPSGSPSQAEIDKKVEELFWVSTLLLVATSRERFRPRIDFFVMHILNATSFVPSLLKYVPKLENQQRLLASLLPMILIYVIIRGRPRINPELMMTHTDKPKYAPDASKAHDALGPEELDPWVDIVREVVHAKDPHTVKAVRSLYIAAKKYALTQPGDVPGAGKLAGTEILDGTIFVRAARVTLDNMGWVMNGDDEGGWDHSGLGWDDAWKDEKPSD